MSDAIEPVVAELPPKSAEGMDSEVPPESVDGADTEVPALPDATATPAKAAKAPAAKKTTGKKPAKPKFVPEVGSLVWSKVKGYPWWPSRVSFATCLTVRYKLTVP